MFLASRLRNHGFLNFYAAAIKLRFANPQMEAILAKDHFVSVLREEYTALAPPERKKKIRELVAESKDNEKFIRSEFPDFFAEAFPLLSRSHGAGRKLVSNSRRALAAKRR